MISALFQKFAWQLGAGAAGLALVVVSGFLIAAQMENGRIGRLNQALDDRITNPTTGLVVQLAQASTNTEVLKQGFNRQVAAMREQAAANEARLAETERRLALAQTESRRTRAQVATLLSERPQGETLEQRVLDVDGRVLEMLE